MKNKVNTPGKYFTKIILFMLNKYLKKKSNINVIRNDTLNIKEPYIILGNHVNNWDPFFINIFIKKPICFVASDRFFRNPLLRILLNYTGAIQKTKFKPDIVTVKKLIKAKKNKRIIGIFPEGNRSWDGNTGEILYSTVKLIKLLKIPIVIAKIEGGSLSQPRWANSYRKGRIIISFEKIIDSYDVKKISDKKIYDILNKSLSHNEYEFQNRNMYTYKGEKLAENLELFLFTCPKCKTIGTMKSSGDVFSCTNCCYKIIYNKYGYFNNDLNFVFFSNTSSWNKWQLEHLKHLIEKNISNKNSLVFSDYNSIIYKKTNNKLSRISLGKLLFYPNKVVHKVNKNHDIIFDINSISGLNIQSNDKIEFYYKDDLYRIKFKDKKISAYKWMQGVNISKRINKLKTCEVTYE